MPFAGGTVGIPGILLRAPPKRKRLEAVAKMLPSLSVGGVLLELVPFLKIWLHVGIPTLLKGFDKSSVSTVSCKVAVTFPLII